MKQFYITLIQGFVIYLLATLLLLFVYDKSTHKLIICVFAIGFILSALFFSVIPLIKSKKQDKLLKSK